MMRCLLGSKMADIPGSLLFYTTNKLFEDPRGPTFYFYHLVYDRHGNTDYIYGVN